MNCFGKSLTNLATLKFAMWLLLAKFYLVVGCFSFYFLQTLREREKQIEELQDKLKQASK